MADYTVVYGDHLTGIASRYGMTWRQLYEHPNNEAYREKRPDPNVLYPGDQLWVPDEDPSLADPEDEAETLPINPLVFHDSRQLYEYKVQDGDSLASIAEQIGSTWEDVALLNWNTCVPEEINWYLGNYFVCTKKNGSNYSFSSTDTPGLLLLPRPLRSKGLRRRRVLAAARRVQPG